MRYYQPVLGKLPVDERRDFKLMTWERFLLLRAWAQWIAWRERCTVALVGSVLQKTMPRDIDVALIWPVAEFEARFGPVPTDKEGYQRLKTSPVYRYTGHALYVSAQEMVEYDTRIDVRLCPDVWWPKKDRVILATPSGAKPPSSWNGRKFRVHKIFLPRVQDGGTE